MSIEDKISNTEKSKSGNGFNGEVNNVLMHPKKSGVIKDFTKEPVLTLLTHKNTKIKPDFKIVLNDGVLIFIDNTKTIRTDRVSQKQWDAFRLKSVFSNKDSMYYYVIVPNKDVIGSNLSREYEIINVENEKKKMKNKDYYSMIDDVLYLDELIELLLSYNK